VSRFAEIDTIQVCEQAYANERDGKHVENFDNARLMNVARFDAMFNYYLALSAKGEFSGINDSSQRSDPNDEEARPADENVSLAELYTPGYHRTFAPENCQVLERTSRETGRYQMRVHE
jgi:hypothetical protein